MTGDFWQVRLNMLNVSKTWNAECRNDYSVRNCYVYVLSVIQTLTIGLCNFNNINIFFFLKSQLVLVEEGILVLEACIAPADQYCTLALTSPRQALSNQWAGHGQAPRVEL